MLSLILAAGLSLAYSNTDLTCHVEARLSMNRGGPVIVTGGWNDRTHRVGWLRQDANRKIRVYNTARQANEPNFITEFPGNPGSGPTTFFLSVGGCYAQATILQ